MGLKERHRLLMSEDYICGIPVLINNAGFRNRNGVATDYNNDPAFFIAGWFDTGSPDSKSITLATTSHYLSDGGAASFRLYDTKGMNTNSVDYWGVTDTSAQTKTVTTAGRYILISICKADAANMYMYYTVDGVNHYLFKGSNVT